MDTVVDMESAASPEHPLRVWLRFKLIAAVLLILAFMAMSFFVAPLDGELKQREYFGEGALPFGLVLESATRLPGNREFVRFVVDPPRENQPDEVVFVEFSSRSELASLFRSSSNGDGGRSRGRGRGSDRGGDGGAGAMLKEWEREHAFDWHTTMKRGEVFWDGWSAKLLIERAFHEGGGWQEQARVDLSSGARTLALLVRWPLEEPVDEDVLRELLRAIVLDMDMENPDEG